MKNKPLQIPEYNDYKQHCINLAKKGRYKEILQYLKEKDFTIIKFVKNDKYIENNCNNNVYLNCVNNFNDKFDCCFKIPDIFYNFFNIKNSYQINDTIKHSLQEIKEKYFTSCFSESSNLENLKMWYLYNNYHGVCLEYSIKKLACVLLCENIIINTINAYNLNHKSYIYLAPIEYCFTPGVTTLEDLDKSFYSIIYKKYPYWQDELEWRIFTYNEKSANGFLLYCIPDNIYFGPLFDSEKLKKIINKIPNGINLYKFDFNYFDMKLEKKLIRKTNSKLKINKNKV